MKLRNQLHSIQFKLTLTFLLILLPLVSVSVFANNYSQSIMDEQIGDRTRGALLTTLEYVDQLTKNMDQQTLMIGLNPSIVDIWNDIDNPLSPDHLYGLHSVQQQLSAITNVNGAIKEAFIIHGESGNGVSTMTGGVRWPEVKQEFWFKQTVNSNGGLVVHIPTNTGIGQSKYLNSDIIYYSRLLDVQSSIKEPNVLVLAVDKASFRKIIQHLQTSDNMNIQLFYNNSFVLETNPASVRGTGNEDEMMSISEASNYWSIQLEQPRSELFRLTHRLQQFTYLIIVVSIIMAVWLAWLVHVEISKPLQKLLAAFKQFSGGNFTTHIVHHRKDKFGAVMNGFNRMADAQRMLIEEDYEKELRLAKSEFSLLQSQINPHFLYNTLDSIYSVAIKNKIQEISEMVINLARFFRVSLGKGRETFTLEETVQHLMYYIRVQQIRTDHFTIQITIEEEAKPVQILKLLLQPVVENAIIHGLERSSQGGELRINANLTGGFLQIEVADTGIGITREKMNHLRNELAMITSHSYRISPSSPTDIYFGLKNVKSRLKLYYGEEADLTVVSVENEGTQVTLRIPLRKGEEG
ncbi:sensor histidine kinase [Paenibacillus qinlingensis]|uniref:histidine kinase n=1 Tax=Paenibacillus qinlingensis TaxID=1837343 RepID=A0ABU1NSZ9_9BACL|nr:sensor histidine kinase [Paenibacillus qinlingensis]MDR6550176.1 two-component system sensor histidine kinase YesM [Paenibacillus qinlingensis]